MGKLSRGWSSAVLIGGCFLTLVTGCGQPNTAPATALDGAPPGEQVEVTLERAISMASILHTYAWSNGLWPQNLELIEELQPSLVGRAALVWGWEHLMLRSLHGLAWRVSRIHAIAPEAVVQGCIFEFVSRDVERVRVPVPVQAAFGLEPQDRFYDLEAMIQPGQAVADSGVPDLSRLEARLWFYHLATLYIDAGLEAIHLGQLERMATHDPEMVETRALIGRIRAYAVDHARRGWVMLDAHTHGIVHEKRLLLDFHSWPLRAVEVGDPEQEDVVLEAGYYESIYGRSLGGVTPDGRRVRHQRVLVELDNGYAGPSAGGCDLPECLWGRDEITWFAHQSAQRRDEYLRYFWRRVPEIDPVARFQMPGVRPVQALLATSCPRYMIHAPGSTKCGGGQVEVVGELWGSTP